MENPKIKTPMGEGEMESLYVSELGFLMLKVYYKNGTFVSYNLGKHDPNNNVFTNQIMKYEDSI